MATLGYTATPNYGYDSYQSTANQVAQLYTMPAPGGIITSVSFYGSGNGGSNNTAYGCIWNSSGILLAQGSGVVTNGGSASAGGQAWHTDTLTASLWVAGGTQLYIGWERSTGTYFDWSFASDGAAVSYHTAASTPANFGSSLAVQNGSVGAYATYSPAGLKVRRSGAWVNKPVYIRRSGAWVQAKVYIRRSGAWVLIG